MKRKTAQLVDLACKACGAKWRGWRVTGRVHFAPPCPNCGRRLAAQKVLKVSPVARLAKRTQEAPA